MPPSKVARVALVAAGVTLAATASADPPKPESDTVNPWNNAPASDAPPPGADGPGAPPPAAAKGKARRPHPARAPKRVPAKPKKWWAKGKRPVWTGGISGGATFQRLDDGVSRISVEIDRKVEITEHKANGRIVFRMKGVGAMDRTNYLPLMTSYFTTQVDRVQLVEEGPDTDLVIDVREASEFSHRIVETPRGVVLQVDFPKPARVSRDDLDVERARTQGRLESQSLKPTPEDRGIKE